KGKEVALAIDDFRPEDEIPHRAGAGAARARQSRRNAAPERRPWTEAGGFEGQELSLLEKHFMQIRKQGAAARRHDQFGRFVRNDSRMAARLEKLAARRVAVKVLGAAATNAQRCASARGFPAFFLKFFQAQKRGRAARGGR